MSRDDDAEEDADSEPVDVDRDETPDTDLRHIDPAGDETLCGRTGYRVVDRAAVETHFEPCKKCFADDVGE